ncbi:uncharacterized protein G2W53_010690 [Senna tora]|uniref:Uncharacterized protein n=1 Tax=Senna tora TaxID=362788 RepID=A0A835CBP5_9FABA|nr:uncharacterized protein G2W53_010690 [Senna tora]
MGQPTCDVSMEDMRCEGDKHKARQGKI